ncbi:MAG: HU family DNA-binding protein [Planctomycetes bacterium]|nr:HU family DNA-binding protein [Planctomycetota bacterium]
MLGKQDIVEFLTTAPKKGQDPVYESAAEAKRAVDNTINAIMALTAGKGAEGLTLVGFGSFRRVKRAARKGINPSTGEAIKIKATKTLTFKVSKAFKEKLK